MNGSDRHEGPSGAARTARKQPPRIREVPILYGTHPVLETLRRGRRDVLEIWLSGSGSVEREIVELASERRIPFKRVPPKEVETFCGSFHHQGVAARVAAYPYRDPEDLVPAASDGVGPLVILDGVQDPGNFGSIIRSADCLGAAGIIFAKDRAVSVTPAVEKSSAGASAHVGIARVTNVSRAIDELKTRGIWVYAADEEATDTLYDADMTGRLALVFGAEGTGIRRLVREKCDGGLALPLQGRIESLNVAQTAAVFLSECLRQRLARSKSADTR